MKICFLGAGSTVFAKNILGDCILTPSLGDFHIALHDIDEKRLDESYRLITSMNKSLGGSATVSKHLNRREALMEADYIINAIQVGGYKPCTVTDFKIPAKYGLKQTIGDTLGIGGIMRGLRTFPVLEEFAKDIAEVCPNAYFLNYTNPMAMLTGYLLKHTRVKAVGLCHSVQDCVPRLFRYLGMQDKIEEAKWEIFGINHQAWLVSIKDGEGVDLYPTIKARSDTRGVAVFRDRVRREIMHTFGYYVTESSEHNAEYTPYFIKARYPGLILKYLIPINEYPRRCRLQILHWKFISRRLLSNKEVKHTKSKEYGSRIIEALHTGKPYRFHGSVLNTRGLVSNLPPEACVEVPIIADGNGLHPEKCGALPEQCAALNLTNINVHLLTLKANQTREMKDIIIAAALDPHTAAELSLQDIKDMCRELYKKHHQGGWLPEYKDE